MRRPPVFSAEVKTRIVLSVLSGETTIAQAARKEQVSEQSIGRWKAEFLEAGKTALAAGRSGPSSRERHLAGRRDRRLLEQVRVRLALVPDREPA